MQVTAGKPDSNTLQRPTTTQGQFPFQRGMQTLFREYFSNNQSGVKELFDLNIPQTLSSIKQISDLMQRK